MGTKLFVPRGDVIEVREYADDRTGIRLHDIDHIIATMYLSGLEIGILVKQAERYGIAVESPAMDRYDDTEEEGKKMTVAKKEELFKRLDKIQASIDKLKKTLGVI